MKKIFQSFYHSKAQETKFYLDKNWSRSTEGHHFWTNLVILSHLMLHTKFQGNQSRGSGEKDFLMFLPYMGMAAILLIRPVPFEQIFKQPLPGACIWNLIKIGPTVSEEKSFENVDKHLILMTVGRGHWMNFDIHRGAWSTFLHIIDYHCFGKILSNHRLALFWKDTRFHLFSIQKPKGPNLTLMKNRSRST